MTAGRRHALYTLPPIPFNSIALQFNNFYTKNEELVKSLQLDDSLATLPELGQRAGTRVGQGIQPGFLLSRQK